MFIKDMPLEVFVANMVFIGSLATCLIFVFRLWARFIKLERQGTYRQEDMAIVFQCLRACLSGLIQVGANGETKATLDHLNKYMDYKAVGLSGDGSQKKGT